MLRGLLAALLSTSACVLDPTVDDNRAVLTHNQLAPEVSILRGRVLHRRTEAPLADLRVQVQCTDMPAPLDLVTDEHGKFQVLRLPAGDCSVCVADGNDRDGANFPLRVGMLVQLNLSLQPERERSRPLTCDGAFDWVRRSRPRR